MICFFEVVNGVWEQVFFMDLPDQSFIQIHNIFKELGMKGRISVEQEKLIGFEPGGKFQCRTCFVAKSQNQGKFFLTRDD